MNSWAYKALQYHKETDVMLKIMRNILIVALIVPSLSVAGEWSNLHLKGADISEFIGMVSRETGKTFIVDPRVKGKVQVDSSKPLDSEGLYALMLATLSVHGFVAVETSDGIKIIPANNAKQSGIDFRDGKRIDNSKIITKLIEVKHAAASDIVPVLRPLIPQYGHIVSIDRLNALIVSDHANNIAEIEMLISKLDSTVNTSVEVVSLENAWASDLMALLEELNSGSGISSAQGGQSIRGSIKIIADERTNRVIIKGDSDSIADAKSLIKSLDTPTRKTNRISVVPLHYASSEKMAQLLSSLTVNSSDKSRMSIAADADQNNLVIMATPSELVDLRSVVAELDVPRAQVLIEAIIVEVSMSNSDAMGFQWLFSDLTGSSSPSMGTNFDVAGNSLNQVAAGVATGTSTLANGFTAGVYGNTIGRINFGGILQLIEESSDANLLSTPKLLTLDNHKAEILVGETRPFQTGAYAESSSNAFVTTTREDIGLSLQVTPHINANDEVTMEVLQTVESASSQASALGTITSKRKIETTVLASNGSTVILGGLMQDNVTSSVQKVPVLGDVPVVGGLFRSTSTAVEKKNLMIFIRPTILHTQDQVTAVTNERFNAFTSIEISEDLFMGRAKQVNDLLDGSL